MLEKFIYLLNNDGMKILMVVIVLDLILGVLRAIKEKSINSCIGIDGMIRKVGMLIVVVFLTIIDSIIHLNLIGFIPETIRETLKMGQVGISSLFNILFIIFEILSIFKNMILCKLPIPKKFQNYLENVMKDFTGELKQNKKEGEEN